MVTQKWLFLIQTKTNYELIFLHCLGNTAARSCIKIPYSARLEKAGHNLKKCNNPSDIKQYGVPVQGELALN
jgi:hypothetical protein